jgi:hypothetical protein
MMQIRPLVSFLAVYVLVGVFAEGQTLRSVAAIDLPGPGGKRFDYLTIDVICFAGVVTYLWRYFGFVGFDLTKFKPVSPLSRIWSLVLAVGFPLLGLLSSFEDKTRITLVGIGIMTILVPAIVPDVEPPESHSLMKQIYFRTVGKWIVNFFESSVVSLLLLVCWIFGPYWVGAYAGVAIVFAVSRSLWVRVQGQEHAREAAPPLRSLVMIFGAAFGWIVYLTAVMPLTRKELQHSELAELYKPLILIIGLLG